MLQREARKKRGLHEQLELRKRLRTLEDNLSKKKKHFYEENDRIRAEQNELITTLEDQLNETSHSIEPIFRFKWVLLGDRA